MKKENAFTLVELLAVLAILAILATVTVPIVLNILNTSSSQAFEDNAFSLSKAADSYYTALTLKSDTKLPLLVTFKNREETNKYLNNANKQCETSNERIIEYTGQNPDSGNIFIDSNGDVYMAVYNKATGDCATKNPGDKKVTLTKKDPSECRLDKSPC